MQSPARAAFRPNIENFASLSLFTFGAFGERALAARSESSRREEALISLLFPRKFEPRYLGCYGKSRFSTGC
jgi:hypothetical protein